MTAQVRRLVRGFVVCEIKRCFFLSFCLGKRLVATHLNAISNSHVKDNELGLPLCEMWPGQETQDKSLI